MPTRYKVVITDFINDALEPELAALREIADVEALCAGDESEFADQLGNADALMVYHNVTLGAGTIAKLNSCKIIVRCGVGTDNIDLAAARERGIDVANIPDYGTEEVADSAIGMMLSLVRGISLYNSRLRDGRGPWGYTQAVPLRRLRGRTLGIVGLGRIGTATALRAKALGMKVAYYDPYKELGYDKALGLVRCERAGGSPPGFLCSEHPLPTHAGDLSHDRPGCH